MTPAADRV